MKVVSLVAATAFLTLAATAASAAIVVNVDQSGGNVVVETSGSLDLTGLTPLDEYYLQSGAQGSDGYIGSGAGSHEFDNDPITLQDGYSGLTGPKSFGSGGFNYASSGLGDAFALNASFFGAPYVFVPAGYVSGAALTSSAIFDGQTLSSLGLAAGTYVYSDAVDSVTINIASAVPEPTTWMMMLIGMGALGGLMRHRRLSIKIAHV